MTEPKIEALSDDRVPAESRAVLEQIQRAIGKVPNLHRTLAHSPAALRSYTDTAAALARGKLSPQHRERIAVATAARNGCGYCASAHTAIGKSIGLDACELTRNLGGESGDEAATAMLAFVGRLLETRFEVGADDFERVRAAGFDDAEIVEILAHVGLNTFTNMFNVAVGTVIDFPEVRLEPTR